MQSCRGGGPQHIGEQVTSFSDGFLKLLWLV